MDEERAKKRRRVMGPRRWHRYLGALFALPLLWLCVSGLLLQHRERLGLTERKVSSQWLLERYGQIPDGEPRVVVAGRFEVAEWGEMLFLDEEVLEESGRLVGAVAKPAELVVATAREIFVYGPQGEYLDRLGEESLPVVPVERLGLDPSGRVVMEGGGGRFVLSDDFLDHEPMEVSGEAAWSVVEEGGSSKKRLSAALAEGAGFTWSRVVTDLHSGSLFGKAGKLVVDLTGIAVIVLTLLGIRLLFKRA